MLNTENCHQTQGLACHPRLCNDLGPQIEAWSTLPMIPLIINFPPNPPVLEPRMEMCEASPPQPCPL